MENSGIYCIRNLSTNEIYVGSSSNLKKRKREHFNYLKNGVHHSRYLQRSYNKTGSYNFVFSVLENCNIDMLIIREQHYIDTLNPRYNICRIAGNTIGCKRTEDTKKKLSLSHLGQKAWNKGIPRTEAEKKTQSDKLKGRPSGVKGKKWSKESRERVSKERIGRPAKNKIEIHQYDKNGKYIASFSSITEAQLITNTKGICQVLTGRCKTANNFIWSKTKTESLPV